MKNKSYVVIGIIMSLLLTGCGEKKEITGQTFKTKMEDKGYQVTNIVDNITNYTYLETAYKATEKDTFCEMNFYQTTDTEHAIYLYDNTKKALEELQDTTKKKTSNNFANYNRYLVTTGTNFYAISRINNTVVIIDSSKSCEKTLKQALKTLGY